MEDKSWIKLYRKILETPIWANEKALKVWIWCLIKATHKDREQLVGKQVTHLEKGQFVTRRKKASEELNMNDRTIYDYLKLLEKLHMIRINSNNKFSVITVEKWEEYQIEEVVNQQQRNNNDFRTFNNKTTAECNGRVETESFEILDFSNKHSNSKITAKKQQGSGIESFKKDFFNNNATTTQHKQECKEIYINLFNKYKSEIQNANSREKIIIIGRCKECEEYSKLTLEEQDQLFYDLMSIDKRYK